MADAGREQLLDVLPFDAERAGAVELAHRLLAVPAIPSVIAGATSAEQVRTNAAASAWVLSAEEIEAIDKLAPVN